MTRLLFTTAFLVLIAGCAHSPPPTATTPLTTTTPLVSDITVSDDKVSLFSTNEIGGIPQGWEPLIIHKTKKRTEYTLVADHGQTVMHARAASASSGLMQKVSINPVVRPWISWDWKIDSLIATANNADRDAEDSPARIILGFDGDKDTLPFTDQILFETARVVTGHDFPYATLMYVWENKAPVGSIIASSRSGRIKMLVAASGPAGVGEWKNFTRNFVEDYEKAFGEKPGKLIGVGILSDTDNTGETVEAWYGDITLQNSGD